MHAQGQMRELFQRGARLVGRYNAFVVHAQVAEIRLIQLEGADARVYGAQHCRVGVLGRSAPRQPQVVHKRIPGKDVRIGFAHVGQHVVDITPEHGVGRYQVHVVGAQRIALGVEQVGDALQQHRRLARPGYAVHEQRGNVVVADDRVLFLLNGGRDSG